MSKKDCHIYIDEKFIRKFGIENKSQIVNDALMKYFFDEKQSYKNDLQIIKDFTDKLDTQRIEREKLKLRLDLIFNMALFSAYSTDVILEEKNKKIITEQVEKIKNEYQKLKDKDREVKP